MVILAIMRQYRSNQGRHPKKENTTFKIIGTALISLLAVTLFIFIKK